MFSLPQSFCGSETSKPLTSFNISPCWRETILDAAIPGAFLVAGIGAVILRKITKRSVGGIRLDYDFLSRTSVDGEDTDSNATTVADDHRSLQHGEHEDRNNHSVIRAVVESTKTVLSAAQAAGFFGLHWYRVYRDPLSQPGPYRKWSVLAQGYVWVLASFLTFTLLFRTLATRRRTSSVRTTHLLNNFFVVAFIFGGLPRLYDLVFAYTDDGKYESYHAQYDEVETYGVLVNAALTGLLALFFAIERRNRKVVEYAPSGLPLCPEKTSSNISQAFFTWVDSLIWLGHKRTLNPEDLWELADGDDSSSIVRKFRQTSGEKAGKERKRLVWRLLKTFKSELLLQAVWGFLWAMLSYCGPFFINRILAYVEHPEATPVSLAYLYTVGLLVGNTLMTTASSQALWIGRKICIRLKGIVMGEVYIKTLKRLDMSGQPVNENDENAPATRGQITNMISVDAQKISEVSAYLHYLYSCPIQIVIGGFFLFSLLGWAAIIGLSAFVLVIPINAWLSQWFERVQDELMKKTDKRIALMGELLQGIRIVKFFAWEENMKSKVLDARNVELKQLKRRLNGWVLSMMIWYCTPILITCTTFVVYTKFFGNELTASIAFTALALFNSIRAPLDMFPDMILATLQCRVSVKRIEKFLNELEITPTSAPPKRSTAPRSTGHSRQSTSGLHFQRSAAGSFTHMMSLSHSMGYESFGTFGESSDPTLSPSIGYFSEHSGIASSPAASHAPSADTHSSEFPTIGFQNASFRWFPTDEDAVAAGSSFALRNLDINFPVGELSIVCGPTGSGKTSMILALLGEMYRYGAGGRAFLPARHNNRAIDPQTGLTEGIAFVAQQAWLQCDTIRNNILFGQPFDHDRYHRVLFACALTRDLEVLEAGDQTEVGEKGITLSGGQKQRVALARAVYSRARHVLLDDCLSAVDAHTAKHIFEHCLQGELMRGRTRILVTHHVGLCLRGAAHVVVMADGKVAAQGPPEALVSTGGLSRELLEDAIAEAAEDEGKVNENAKVNMEDTKKKDDNEDKKACGKLIKEEGRAEGRIQWSVYSGYFKASGGLPFWAFLMAMFGITQLFAVSEDFWLRIWARAYQSASAAANFMSTAFLVSSMAFRWAGVSRVYSIPGYNAESSADEGDHFVKSFVEKRDVDVDYYLEVYVLLALGVMLSTTSRGFLQFWGSLRASRLLYAQLLDRIINAPMRFFDTTPIGRLMNRFSKDFETIDQQVAGDLGILIMDTLYTLTVLVVITSVTPLFAIAAVIIVVIFWVMGTLYLKTSRELKRLESISKSPCFSLLDETIVGVTTIRAFGEERRFVDENFNRIDAQIRPFIWIWAANRWLSIRVDIAGALVSFFASWFVLSGNMDAGLAGFCLTYALMFTDRVLWVVRFYSVNEMNLNSVERVQEYLSIDQEPPAVVESFRPPAAWPEAGRIDVEGLVLQYAPDLPPVLRGLSFQIEPGEKVGIVGRTGAGKSTLALAFFRFVEASAGKIFIDGIDIFKLGLKDLRSRLTIIPQDPVLFTGTVRSNLDPFGEHEDSEIWAALRRAHLIGVENTNGELAAGSPFSSLDAVVSENGANFSQGQRQLLALARALVKNSKVIIMDEATASVDFETDAKIQKTVKEEFSSSTLVVIAHRLRTVVDYDKIMVLDHGQVVEFGDPFTLLMAPPASEEVLAASQGMKHGLFRSMCERTGAAEFDALLEIASAKKAATAT